MTTATLTKPAPKASAPTPVIAVPRKVLQKAAAAMAAAASKDKNPSIISTLGTVIRVYVAHEFAIVWMGSTDLNLQAEMTLRSLDSEAAPFEACPNAKDFSQLVGNLTGSEVTLGLVPEGLAVESGNIQAILSIHDHSQFPKFAEVEPEALVYVNRERLVYALEFGQKAAMPLKESHRPEMQGVFLRASSERGTLEIFGTDTHRFAYSCIPQGHDGKPARDDLEVIVPRDLLEAVLAALKAADDDLVEITVDHRQAQFSSGGTSIRGRLLDRNIKYPPVQKVFDRLEEANRKVVVDRKPFLASVKRAQSLGEEAGHQVYLTFNGDRMRVLGISERGRSREWLDVLDRSTETLHLRLDGSNLEDMLSRLEGDQVTLTLGEQVSPFKLKGESEGNYAALMPMSPASDLWDGGDPDR